MYQEIGGSSFSGCATQIKSWLYENTGKKNYFFLSSLSDFSVSVLGSGSSISSIRFWSSFSSLPDLWNQRLMRNLDHWSFLWLFLFLFLLGLRCLLSGDFFSTVGRSSSFFDSGASSVAFAGSFFGSVAVASVLFELNCHPLFYYLQIHPYPQNPFPFRPFCQNLSKSLFYPRNPLNPNLWSRPRICPRLPSFYHPKIFFFVTFVVYVTIFLRLFTFCVFVLGFYFIENIFFFSASAFFCAAISLRAVMKETIQRITKTSNKPAEASMVVDFKEDA